MALTTEENKTYSQAPEVVYQAALGAVDGLGGSIERQDPAAGTIAVNFDKKILGKVLGDRTHLSVAITEADAGTAVALEAYPLDAIGRPLKFGARKGVAATIVSWFVAHLEHRLKESA